MSTSQSSQETAGSSKSKPSKASSSNPFDDDFDSEAVKMKEPPQIRRKKLDPERPGWDDAITKVKINKEHKPVSFMWFLTVYVLSSDFFFSLLFSSIFRKDIVHKERM